MKKIFFLVITCLIFTYPIAGFAQEELDEKIETLYKQGVSLYKDNRLDEADAIFIKLLRVNPEHQGAQLYLYEKIPDKIALRKAEESALKNQEELAKRNPSKENIETFYQTAVSLYNKNQLDIDKAKVLFAKILKLDPDHKGAKIYLNQKIPDKIEKKRQLAKRRGRKRVQAEIDSLYAEGRSLYDSGELDKARATFYKIFVFDPDHKGTKIYLREKIPDKIEQAKLAEQRRVEELRRQEEEAREELRRQQEQAKERARQEKIDTLYKEAIVLYNDDQLDKAKESLVNVLELDPNHKGANFYLDKKIPDKIEQAKVAEERRLKELARQEEQAKLAEQRRLEQQRRQEQEAKEKVQLEKKQVKEEAPTEYVDEVLVYDADRVRQEQFAKQEIILEEATQVYKAQTRDDQAMAKDLERARQGQFAKEEAIVEAKAKAYKERITQESLAKDQEEKAEEVTVKEVIVKEEPATEPEKETPVSGEIEHEYRISTGDSLEISLYGEPDMKQVTRVSEEGVITYPFLGSLEVGGLTPQEAEKKIEELLGKEYFVNPQVRITIKSYAKFNILGEVRRPGSYEISGPMTVIDAISIAGGFTDIASQNGVRIVRKQGDKSRIIKVPVKHILKTGDNSKNVYIKKGDTIVVPESFF